MRLPWRSRDDILAGRAESSPANGTHPECTGGRGSAGGATAFVFRDCVPLGEMRVGCTDAGRRPKFLIAKLLDQILFSMLNVGSQRDGRWSLARRPFILLATLLPIVVGGCNGIGTNGGASFTTEVATEPLNAGVVNVDQIDRGQYGDIVEGTQTVLRDEETYASFWERLHADRGSVPDRPNVDFEEEIVVAIVLGQRSTGGYGVEIGEVLASDGGGQIQVQFTETMPGNNCVVTQALTSPYVLATVEAQDENFKFDGSEETRSC